MVYVHLCNTFIYIYLPLEKKTWKVNVLLFYWRRAGVLRQTFLLVKPILSFILRNSHLDISLPAFWLHLSLWVTENWSSFTILIWMNFIFSPKKVPSNNKHAPQKLTHPEMLFGFTGCMGTEQTNNTYSTEHIPIHNSILELFK